MRNYWQTGIMLLFVLSSIYFLWNAFANKRRGKPFRRKNGNAILLGMSSTSVMLLLAALILLLLKNYDLMQLAIITAYVLSTSCGTLFVSNQE